MDSTPSKAQDRRTRQRGFEVRFEPEMHRRLQAAAERDGNRSLHSLVISILAEWLREHPEEEERSP
jgi:predicted HicB family RNase H-like nuclease